MGAVGRDGAVLLIGETGAVGPVASQLRGAGASVRVLTPGHGVSGLPDGVEPASGDLAAPESLGDCLKGVEAVYLDWPYDRRAGRFHAAGAAAGVVGMIVRNVRRLVFVSSHAPGDAPERPADPTTAFYARLGRLIRGSGLEWTALRPCMRAGVTRQWAPQIRAGDVVRGPYAASARSLIDERDVAAVAARVLTGAGHAGASYVLTGPESLTHAEQVRAIGEAIGRPLRYEEVAPDLVREALSLVWPPELADAVLAALAARVSAPEPVTTDVEEVTGSPPRTFREWAVDHADAFR